MQICLNFKINISNSELLCFTSYNVRLKLLSYVAITEMSKNLIKIAKVNFAGTTHKKIFATATTTCKRSVKYLNMQPHTHTHTQQQQQEELQISKALQYSTATFESRSHTLTHPHIHIYNLMLLYTYIPTGQR